jgi:DHA1 family 2-module integral membrane pump EmrD-like MFS transporter
LRACALLRRWVLLAARFCCAWRKSLATLVAVLVYKSCLSRFFHSPQQCLNCHLTVVDSSRIYGNAQSLILHFSLLAKVFSDMKKQRNVNLLLMLVLLVAVGQMAQTIYIPAIADMAKELNVREGAVQSMAAYLLTYGVSQLFYGPLSDRVGRRPVILVGMSIFMVATVIAITTHSLTVLIAASALQGVGTGVGGVMARTLPRDLYQGTQLRHANSLLNMGILVSPLLAPLIGGLLDTMWSWRACYAFLLVLCVIVTFSMARWMPETRPTDAPRTKLITSYKTLFGNGRSPATC